MAGLWAVVDTFCPQSKLVTHYQNLQGGQIWFCFHQVVAELLRSCFGYGLSAPPLTQKGNSAFHPLSHKISSTFCHAHTLGGCFLTLLQLWVWQLNGPHSQRFILCSAPPCQAAMNYVLCQWPSVLFTRVLQSAHELHWVIFPGGLTCVWCLPVEVADSH
jgi:hypothetical protein